MPLTPQQIAARDHVMQCEPNLGIRARAGTGKSFTIVEAIKTIPRHKSTLVVAFNKDIATAMEAKVRRGVHVKTLHGLGYGAIQRARGRSLPPDSSRLITFARAIVPNKPLYNHRSAVALVRQLSSLAMCHLAVTPETIEPLMRSYGLLPDPVITRREYAVWAAELLAECRKPAASISFDEMVFLPAIENIYTGNYSHVLFDEAQDCNPSQERLVLNALSQYGKGTVVFDDRQCIYRFRGASVEALDALLGKLEAEVLPLTVTFRCPRRVVELVQPLVEDYSACDGAPEGRVTWVPEDHIYSSIQPGHVVIARSNFFLSRICIRLAKKGIRARIVGKDYADKFQGLIDLAPGTSTAEMITWLGQYRQSEADRLEALGDNDRAEELGEIVETIRELSEGLRTQKQLADRLADIFVDPKSPDAVRCVKLMTVHKAKGLEWSDVWMMETSFSLNSLEGENLYYIAATRTKWEPQHHGHLRLVQTPRKDGSWPPSIAKGLLPRSVIEQWESEEEV